MDRFCSLLRYFSLMCAGHTSLEMPCNEAKSATSVQVMAD